MERAIFLLFLCGFLTACGYHRLDRAKKSVPWASHGETINLGRITNNSNQGGLEDIFKKAVENRIIASSPWRLLPPGSGSDWILQGEILSFEVRPLGLNLRSGKVNGAAGAASRVEIIIKANLLLLNGQTGEEVVSRKSLTFRNQYQVDENFASFDNKELQVIQGMADDFAESFLTQLLEGYG